LPYGREEGGSLLVGCFDEAAKTIDPASPPEPFTFALRHVSGGYRKFAPALGPMGALA